jgi:hypothetical protein
MNARLSSFFALGASVVAVACSSATVDAPSGTSEQAAIEDADAILRLPDGRYDVRCRDGRRETVSADDLRADRVCRTGGGPVGFGVVLYGRSDSCSGEAAAVVRESTRCESLGNGPVWSVSVNGVCSDVADTTLSAACSKYKGALGEHYQIFGRSDSCSGEIAAFVNAATDCNSLGNDAAWSVKKNGQCRDIRDTTVAEACRQFQGGVGPSLTIFGRSDSCSGEVAAFVNAGTTCSSLGTGSAWSVKVGDECIDISDTTVSAACDTYKGAIGPHMRIFGRSDSCSGDVSAFVNASTNCDTLSSSAPAWSVLIDGRCQDISDTNVRDACRRFGGGF